jgi:hypothetical protein
MEKVCRFDGNIDTGRPLPIRTGPEQGGGVRVSCNYDSISGEMDDYVCVGNRVPGVGVAVSQDLNAVLISLLSDPKCADWLSSGSGGFAAYSQAVTNLNGLFTTALEFLNKDGTYDDDTYATTDDITGYSFRVILNWQTYGAARDDIRYDTILHELAHILGAKDFNQNDADDQRGQDSNEALLQKNCAKTIHQ